MTRIVVPFGFYGAGNIGDEATLVGFAQFLALNDISVEVSVASRNPVHTARVEPSFRYFGCGSRDPRRWLATLRGNAQAVIGGTPIMDIQGEWPLNELAPLVRAVGRWRVPMAFIGVGTETLRGEQSRRILAEEIAPYVRHWSVRSDRDRERLVEYGVSANAITVASDMAWLIDPSTDVFGRECFQQWGVDGRRPLIGVNLVNENALFDRQPGLVGELARALDQLSEDIDAQIVFLANEVREHPQFDRGAALEVIGEMRRTDSVVLTPNQYLTPRQMMSVIACCDMTISMRYHFCMFSALQGVPFVAIKRSDKLADFCWDIDWSASVDPSSLKAVDVVEHARQLRENASVLRGNLKQCVQKMRERAGHNVAALEALSVSRELMGVRARRLHQE